MVEIFYFYELGCVTGGSGHCARMNKGSWQRVFLLAPSACPADEPSLLESAPLILQLRHPFQLHPDTLHLATQSGFYSPAVLAVAGKMQNLRPHSGPTRLESAF